MKKLKKLNKRIYSNPSFSLLELILVIIIIGILSYSISVSIPDNKLQILADNLIKDIRFTQSLALKDDKYYPLPLNNTYSEMNRSKYWFKQWWQIRFFKNTDGDFIVEIFSDLTYRSNNDLFDKKGREPKGEEYWNLTYAKDPLTGKYMTGECRVDDRDYPPCNAVNLNLDLTKKFGIKEIMFNDKKVSLRYSKRLVFDNYGNVFLDEGKYAKCPLSYTGDCGDINPLDKNYRPLLTQIMKIKLCLDEDCISLSKNHCIQLNVMPTGYLYISNCLN